MDQNKTSYDTVYENITKEIQSLEEEKNIINGEMDLLRQEFKNDKQIIDSEIDVLLQNLENVSMDMDELLEKIERAENRSGVPEERKKNTINGYNRLFKNLEEKEKELQQKISDLNKEKEEKSKNLNKKLDDLIKKMKPIDSDINVKKPRQEYYSSLIDAKKKEMEKKQEEIDNARKRLDDDEIQSDEEALKSEERKAIIKFIKSQDSDSDIFKDYAKSDDSDDYLAIIKEKYATEFDAFVKEKEGRNKPIDQVVEPVPEISGEPSQISVEGPAIERVDNPQKKPSSEQDNDFEIFDQLKGIDPTRDTLVLGSDISASDLGKDFNKPEGVKKENNGFKKAGDLLPGMGSVPENHQDEDIEKPEEDLLPPVVSIENEENGNSVEGDNAVSASADLGENGSDVSFEVTKRSKVVSIVDGAKGLIKELVDTKHGRALAALVAIGGAVAVVATGPVGFTALGTIASGLGSAATIAGGGVLSAAAVNEIEKGKRL